MRLLAIDPGTRQSAWVLMDTTATVPVRLADGSRAERPRLIDFGIVPNDDLLLLLRGIAADRSTDAAVIERVQPLGMSVSDDVFETVYWSGRFAEALHPRSTYRLGRKVVKAHLCGTTRAKDPNVNAVVKDRYGGDTAKGTKASPGPLYGVSRDVWAALAVGLAWLEGAR